MNKKKQELGQNELADSLETGLERIKPYLPKIAMFSAVAVLGVIAVAFWMNTKKAVNESQWREYFVSSRFPDARGMKTVAEMYPNTTVGNLALINSADSDFAAGSQNIMLNKDQYSSNLRKAAEEYEKVIESSKVSPFAKMRATYALGYTYESLGRFDDAREMYEAVSTGYPDTAESELADKSLKRINDSSITAIHTAFKEWVPSATDVAPGSMGSDTSLPRRPDIGLPTEMEQAPQFNPGENETPEDSGTSEDTGGDESESETDDELEEQGGEGSQGEEGSEEEKSDDDDGINVRFKA